MAKILHVVNSFDPAGSVVRDVEQLRKYSRHKHALYVREVHPFQKVYQYPLATKIGNQLRHQRLLKWCDAIIYHFKGWRGTNLTGPFVGLDDPNKPAAFRSLNVYYDKEVERSWTMACYDGRDSGFDRYSIFAGCHVGAKDSLPTDRPFFWAQCMTATDGLYSPHERDREPCVSFIKHEKELSLYDFGSVHKLNLNNTPLKSVLARRRMFATVVIDNISDGHYGLAGTEALMMGLPVVVFNSPETRYALLELTQGVTNCFYQCDPSIDNAVDVVKEILNCSDRVQEPRSKNIRAWAEKYFHPKFLIEKQWDLFCDALVNS